MVDEAGYLQTTAEFRTTLSVQLAPGHTASVFRASSRRHGVHSGQAFRSLTSIRHCFALSNGENALVSGKTTGRIILGDRDWPHEFVFW